MEAEEESTAERWFSDEELADLPRPTMDRAVDAVRAGELDRAIRLCQAMTREWRPLHDVLVAMILGLIDYVKDIAGEAAVPDAWEHSLSHAWREQSGSLLGIDRKAKVEIIAASWRARSDSGTDPHPARFGIVEEPDRLVFRMNPCGSGQRSGHHRGPNAAGVTRGAYDWTYERRQFPLHCTHCTFMNESLSSMWYGMPLYPSNPPGDFDSDPCEWYWYKDTKDIPEEFWSRYGTEKSE